MMLVHLTGLDAALPAWRASARRQDAAPVLAALDGVNAALAVHLPDEETNIVPVMETTITQKEVEWFSEHGRRSIPKGQTWNQLGEILAAQPDGGDEWLHSTCRRRRAWRGGGSAGRRTRSTAPRSKGADPSGEAVLEGEHDELHPVAQGELARGSG